jgi:hypothetical protein
MKTSKHQYKFTRKDEALRIIKRLWDHGLLSKRVVSERGNYVVEAEVPVSYTGSIDHLVERLRTERR